MTEISGKSLHEIYKEEARRYKESIEKERVYSESEDILTGNFDKSESLTVTMPMEEFDKLEKLALSAHTDKLSVEKLQEQLNTAKKALKEVAGGHTVEDAIFNHQLIASKALAAIEKGENNEI
ncbi:hypothetical protein [Lactococcus cremoris]|uniref:Uncharacterized protein n=1 Tax=Lactococcus cremoris subsp. cremoris IBB477 TaxID=1449093 RepID=A0A1E7G6Y1_LACLC|nr:hypothetical protein [Lactococcus cremoris]MCT0478554.1 hypothetical protein [Lactococcus cremoris]OEU40730.1 hypothetical protein AJ89_02235 [Lactococcus cremoris subsp. cremoris IBB477]